MTFVKLSQKIQQSTQFVVHDLFDVHCLDQGSALQGECVFVTYNHSLKRLQCVASQGGLDAIDAPCVLVLARKGSDSSLHCNDCLRCLNAVLSSEVLGMVVENALSQRNGSVSSQDMVDVVGNLPWPSISRAYRDQLRMLVGYRERLASEHNSNVQSSIERVVAQLFLLSIDDLMTFYRVN